MENKEVEQILLESNIQHPLIIGYIEQLEKEKAEAVMVANCISVNHKHLINLKKESADLMQQLKAKDKALDKAIKSRELIDDCPPEHNGCLLDDGTYDGEQYACDFCWKKWCENGKEWAENGTD